MPADCESARAPLCAVPGSDVEVDGDGAALVMTFPRAKGAGGVVDPNGQRKDAHAQALKIFMGPKENYPDGLKALDCLRETVAEGEYQRVIRSYFQRLLCEGGFLASSSKSIDGDEVFLKVSLSANHARLKKIAEHYRYKMPLKKDAIAEHYRGKVPLEKDARDRLAASSDDAGVFVRPYVAFADKIHTKLEDFRQVDEIRLIRRWLLYRVSPKQMQKQKVISRYFPAPCCKESDALNETWATFSRSCSFDCDRDLEAVRNYFGEQIAFFFTWFNAFNRHLAVLAAAACVMAARQVPSLGDQYRRWLLEGFAVFLVGWIACFNQSFRRQAVRLRQLWGMADWDSLEAPTHPNYNPGLEGSLRGKVWKAAARTCVVLYNVVFGSLIIGISVADFRMREAGDLRFKGWSPYIISIVMKVCSFAWGSLASKVVLWENHRTAARFNNSLAWTLASVKLFVALFPFASLAFLESWLNTTCGDSLAGAAVQVYEHLGWPLGTAVQQRHANVTAEGLNVTTDLGFLQTYYSNAKDVQHGGERYCISGCFPQSCWEETVNGSVELVCTTNCWESLATQLVTFYLLQVLSCAIFLIIPILLTRASISREKAIALGEGNTSRTCLRVFFGGLSGSGTLQAQPYSPIQFQAKCNTEAPYEHGSWGGSYVEDFLDLTVGFALLACFGLVVPEMAVVGLASQMLMYRLLAYRMLNVTGRPWPNGAEGIGTWQDILQTIGTLAVTCNVGLATFVMAPIRQWPMEWKLLFFILAEKLLFSVQSFVDAAVKDEPDDVVRIDDHNEELVSELTGQPLDWETGYDFLGVDISFAGHA